MSTRRFILAALLGAAALAGCASAPAPAPAEARAALAPGGTLRIGVYPGSPSSMLRTPGSDEMRGVSVDVGRELGRRLGVPTEVVVFQRAAEVVDALKAGRADMTVTNATLARAAEVAFSAPLLGVELGYLVLPESPVSAIDAVDRPGVRVGVSQGSTSQGVLTRQFIQASVVPVPSLQAAADALKARQLDAFATNKAILFEMADTLPGARVLEGRWGLEHLAIAVPKGRDAGLPYLRAFADDARASGVVRRAVERAGLRGTADVAAP
jgi:polar amino acid transport system substrate-binding protein